MATPHTLDDFLRVHDEAIMDWLSGLLVDYTYERNDNVKIDKRKVPILKVFATPQRAFSDLATQLITQKTDFLPPGTDAAKFDNAKWFDVMPLPVVSVSRPNRFVRDPMASNPSLPSYLGIDPITGRAIMSRMPVGGTIDYALNFWCQKRYTEAYITEWIENQFGKVGWAPDERALVVKHRAPIGPTNRPLKNMGSTDLSDLEGDEQRYIRFEYTVTLKAYLYPGIDVPAPDSAGDADTSAVDPVEFIGHDLSVQVLQVLYDDLGNAQVSYEELAEEDPPVDPPEAIRGVNLFASVPESLRDRVSAAIPVTGTATARMTGARALTLMGGTAGGDVTLLVRASTRFDVSPISANLGLYGVAFDYVTDQTFTLRVETAPDGNADAAGYTLGQRWRNADAGRRRVQVFAPVTDPWFRVVVAVPAGAQVDIANVDIHPIAPSSVFNTSAGGQLRTAPMETKGRPALAFALPSAPATGSAGIAGVPSEPWADHPKGICVMGSSTGGNLVLDVGPDYAGVSGAFRYNGGHNGYNAGFDA